jgi:glutamate-1-semialdehyde 2,1-aminomutase
MPGGVNSPVRAYNAVGRTPVTVKSGKGPRVTDVDGHEYIDYVGSYGPLILGHAPEQVVAAVTKAAGKSTTFGMPTELETTLAEMVVEAVPSIDLVRFVNSGTEAAMSAVRVARAATGRDKVIKCTGNYHGASDSLLAKAGSGAMTLGLPGSPGIPESITQHTLLVPYNDLAAVDQAMREYPEQIAAMCVEPVAGNMGCVPPNEGYLQGLRELCDKHGVLLLFDEVMSGFRVSYGGAQALYGVTPDLTCLGKIVGGGLPCAAFGGRSEVMRQVAPDGPVYQSGTLSGNPLAMASGIATLEAIKDGQAHEQLEQTASQLETGLGKQADKAGVPVYITRVGSMLSVFFHEGPVTNFDQASQCRTDRFAAFFGSMLDQGIMLAPAQYEAWFVSTAHDESCITATLDAAGNAFKAAAAVA